MEYDALRYNATILEREWEINDAQKRHPSEINPEGVVIIFLIPFKIMSLVNRSSIYSYAEPR